MTPGLQLRSILKSTPRDMLDGIAATGIEPRLIRRAIVGQSINASTHLRLCAAIGSDPVTQEAKPASRIGEFHRPSLASAIRIHRIVEKVRRRAAAERMGLKVPTLCRIEYGEPVSIEAVLIACKWIGRHPYDFCSPYISRETSETRSAA